jgi:transposase InsO family protein
MFVFTFSGWVEAFPTWTEKAQEVVTCLLKEIIPQFGIPVSIGSDNGPAFVAKVVQLVAEGLGITWKLHMACRPQSSGKNGTYEWDPKIMVGENYVRRPICSGINHYP